MMMLVLLRLQMLGVSAGVMRALPTLLVLILGCTGMAMRAGGSLRIAGSPIAQLVVLPGAPMAESHLASTSAGPSRSRTTTATTGRVTRRGKVRAHVQAKSANVTHVGGLGGIGGMERLSGKGHVAGIAVGAITDVLGGVHPTSTSTSTPTATTVTNRLRWMSVPPLMRHLGMVLGGIVRRISGRCRMASPSSSPAAGGHASTRRKGGGSKRPHLRRRSARQEHAIIVELVARDATETAKGIVGNKSIQPTASDNKQVVHHVLVSRQDGLPLGGILGHGLGHRGGTASLHPAAQLRSNVGSILPKRVSAIG